MIHIERVQRAVSGGRMWKHGVWVIVVVLSLVIAAAIVLLIMGSLVDPTSNIFTFVSSGVGTTLGPHLILLSLIVLLIGMVGLRSGLKRLCTVAMVVATIAFLASAVVTAQIVQAVDAAGGSANPVSGLWLSPMAGASPDIRETYTTADGQALHALVYEPAYYNGGAPIMMYIHGGGWIEGKVDETSSELRWFARHGWVVVSVEYRLASSSDPTWDKAPRDVACALVWTARNASHVYNQWAANSIGDQGRLTITQHYLVQRGIIRS